MTPFQKFYHLRSALTGKAARTIQSLDITEPNYSIAINILRDKFDCHRQICARHWHALLYYPKMATETPESVEDLVETFKINLKALEKLGDPLTSNIAIWDPITSKLRPPMASHVAKQNSAQLYTFIRLPPNKGKRRSEERSNTNDKKGFLPTLPSSSERATRTYVLYHTQDDGVSNMPRTPRNKTLQNHQSKIGNKMI